MGTIGWSGVANQYNTETGAALNVNASVTQALGYGQSVGGRGAVNLYSGTAALNLDFANATSLNPLITFSRTSNATVTNSAGLITYAPMNLLTYSEQFDNAAWQKLNNTSTNPVVTANAVIAPNGYQTAESISIGIIDAVGDYSIVSQSITTTTSANYTGAVYVKATSAGDIGKTLYCYLNDAGTFRGLTGFVLTADWQRISVTGSLAAGTSRQFTFGGLGSSLGGSNQVAFSVDVWGAQLEIGSTATTYNPTTVKNLLGYTEAFDNAAWTKSNSFVQTNLLKYSEDFSVSASWNAASGITSNTTIAPNGYQTADTIDVALAIPFQAVTCTASTVYTYSAYIQLGTLAAADFKFAVRNDTGGTFIAQDIVPTEALTTGSWTRITYTFTTPVGCVTVRPYLYRNNASPTGTFFAWGAQLVQGSVAGDYRRTDAAALPVFYANHNGVVCAEQIQSSAANGTTLESYTATGGSMTFSIWLRRITGTGNVDITMDTGATWTTQTITTSWARYSITTTPTSGARTAGVRLVTSGDVIQVFGAQLSDSASLDPYVLNAAAAPSAQAYYGARFDYDPVTLAPKGLLIEEQRSNLCLYSGTTSDALWTVSGVSKTSTNNQDPFLTSSALLATSGGASAQHFVTAGSVGTAIGTTYTMSCYVKPNTNSLIQLTGSGTAYGTSQYANFSLTGSGSVTASTGGTASIQQNANGWYRISFTVVATGTTGAGLLLAFIDSGTDARVPTNTNSGSLYLWGAQLEAGAQATSYIPTAASAVTRAADVAVIQGSNFYSWYNQDVGSFYSIADAANVSAYSFIAAGSSATGALQVYFYNAKYAGGLNGVFEINSGTAVNNTFLKGSFGYKATDYAVSANGATVSTSTNATVPLLLSSMSLGNRASGFFLNGHIKQISYYNTRLPNSTLQSLTS